MNMKKLFALFLTILMAFTMSISSMALVSPAETKTTAGQTVTVTFSYDGIGGFWGDFDLSKDGFIESIHFAPNSAFSSEINEEEMILACVAGAPSDFTVTLTCVLNAALVAGDSCDIILKYETSVDGRMPTTPDYKYETATIVILPDYSALEAKIAEAEALDGSLYTTETWADLVDALTAAREARNATTQPEVDTATAALDAAIKALEKKPEVPTVDYEALKAKIAEARALEQEKYFEEGWLALEKALRDAENALSAATQGEVDAATNALDAAIKALVLKPDYSELEALIGVAETLKPEDYTEESWNAFLPVLDDAKKALNATTQDEVDAAVKALEDAIAGLVRKPTADPINYDLLNEQIGIAQEKNPDDYTEESWAKLEEALEEAIAAREATSQEVVDAATKKLKEAIAGLEEKKPDEPDEPDYTELNEIIGIAQELKKEDYTAESWEKLEKALEAAIEARKSKIQSEIDAAAEDLEEAIKNLVKVPVKEPDTGAYDLVIPFAIAGGLAMIAMIVVCAKKRKSAK